MKNKLYNLSPSVNEFTFYLSHKKGVKTLAGGEVISCKLWEFSGPLK
jgi:hypothetical protein